MKHILIFFFIALSKLNAQDTLIFKNDSKKIVDIIDVTETDVIFKKVNDKKERSIILPFSQLKSIHYSDSTKLNVDSIFQLSIGAIYSKKEQIDRSTEKVEEFRKPDKDMYKKGVDDANLYYTFDDFFLSSKRSVPLLQGEINQYRENSTYRHTDRNMDYPDKNLSKNQDYRSGYVDEVVRKRTKYRIATVGVLGFVIFSVIFISTAM